jgi:GNAT superfamily N-acetyltransferase
MQVELATPEIIPAWVELSREVELLFEGAMAEDKGFHEFMHRKIAQQDAFIVRDEANSNELMGLIAVSRTNNAISWFAVSEKHKRKGIGSRLLENAIKELDNTNEISVVTFREDNQQGIPARKLYKKFGFRDFDTGIFHKGKPRCIMKRPQHIQG